MGLPDPGEAEPLGIVAHASSGRRDQNLVDEAIRKVHARSGGQPVAWYSDSWQAYTEAIRRAYRRPVRTGRVGRPPLRVPEGLSLTQTIKHRDERGRLLEVEQTNHHRHRRRRRAAAGAGAYRAAQWGVQGPAGGLTRRTRLPRPPRRGMRCLGCRYSSTTGCGTIRH